EEDRKEERFLWELFEQMRPYILGAMFDALSGAMRILPQVLLDRLPRLADFARWGVAIAQALGHDREEFLAAFGVNIAAQNETALEESLVGQAVLGLVNMAERWEGTATELLKELESRHEELRLNLRSKAWPKSASALSRRLREILPNLRQASVQVEEQRPAGVTRWIISRGGGEIAAFAAIAPTSLASSPGSGPKMPPHSGPMPLHESAMPPQEMPAVSYESGGVGGIGGIFPHSTEDDDSGFPSKRPEHSDRAGDPWESFLEETEEDGAG
ncbi:MAG: hypothetical protein ACE5Q6_25940, partial [Dehalococcoidia bacterium]